MFRERENAWMSVELDCVYQMAVLIWPFAVRRINETVMMSVPPETPGAVKLGSTAWAGS
jgi:hypothetical protein